MLVPITAQAVTLNSRYPPLLPAREVPRPPAARATCRPAALPANAPAAGRPLQPLTRMLAQRRRRRPGAVTEHGRGGRAEHTEGAGSAASAPPGPAGGSPTSARVGAGGAAAPLQPPRMCGLRPRAATWGLQQSPGIPGTRPPRLLPARAPGPAPNWPREQLPAWLLPPNQCGGTPAGPRGPQAGFRQAPNPDTDSLASPMACFPYSPIAAPLAPTWRRQQRQLQRQLQQTIWRPCRTAARDGQTTFNPGSNAFAVSGLVYTEDRI